MTKTRLFLVAILATFLSLTSGCAMLGLGGSNAKADIMEVMAQYETAFEALEVDAIMALIADDYSGPNGDDKAAVEEFYNMLRDNSWFMGMSVENVAVTVDGNTATVLGTVVAGPERDYLPEYTMSKTDKGWQVSSVYLPE